MYGKNYKKKEIYHPLRNTVGRRTATNCDRVPRNASATFEPTRPHSMPMLSNVQKKGVVSLGVGAWTRRKTAILPTNVQKWCFIRGRCLDTVVAPQHFLMYSFQCAKKVSFHRGVVLGHGGSWTRGGAAKTPPNIRHYWADLDTTPIYKTPPFIHPNTQI